ncbi:hypothetical protein [Ornithinimicrobium avium]|uniref:Uncharacterized protein n=1 Tax=Ornithinimicrobium avium TaxID=2283195 RepID=A0A345NSD1_9MICO|nr:hypothetical protein [Ornithinimicrobium avium]AXH97939.1 hypothetical protein DV701_05165 [Ornithinimicrobium avium]
MTTTTIDCDTCPVRGRHCGDCFVPVLARLWLEDPAPREQGRGAAAPDQDGPFPGLPLDSDELAAVSAFVRAGLVSPEEADLARAETATSHRVATG